MIYKEHSEQLNSQINEEYNRPSTEQKPLRKIGSCRLGKINYDTKDHFFKLDKKMREFKIEYEDWKDPDILDLKKRNWNNSTSSKSIYQIFKNTRSPHKNYSNSKITCITPNNKIYSGTEEKYKDFLSWNCSNKIVKEEVDIKESYE